MTRKLIIAMAACLVAVAGLGVLAQMADANPPTAESTKAIMKKLNGKAQTSVQNKLKKQFEGTKPDWKEVKASTKEFADLTAEMEKNEPKKGELDSWKKLAGAYASDAKSLNESAEKEDLDGTKATFKKLSGSCKACHSVHRP